MAQFAADDVFALHFTSQCRCTTVDQPFWVARVYRRGISPPPAAESSLTEETLAKIFLSFDDAALIERAALLGERINAENGTENAAAYLLARA